MLPEEARRCSGWFADLGAVEDHLGELLEFLICGSGPRRSWTSQTCDSLQLEIFLLFKYLGFNQLPKACQPWSRKCTRCIEGAGCRLYLHFQSIRLRYAAPGRLLYRISGDLCLLPSSLRDTPDGYSRCEQSQYYGVCDSCPTRALELFILEGWGEHPERI